MYIVNNYDKLKILIVDNFTIDSDQKKALLFHT